MSKYVDLTGRRFGRWEVLSFKGQEGLKGLAKFLCRCDCGIEKVVLGTNLTRGRSLSCGCSRIDGGFKHGQVATSMYYIWQGMKQRCNNPNDNAYKYYGARGIKVCKRWSDDFTKFVADMGDRPTNKHGIERIDNDKGYKPSNCKWASSLEQMNNTRKNIFIEYMGKRKTQSEWARELGVNRSVISYRYRAGWSIEDIFNKPVKKCKETQDE